jgi:alanyl-tRNA synthetase
MVRENYKSNIKDGISMSEAGAMGAMALFGEKYGDRVRVVSFGESVELCGGTHVENTGTIGIIKIVSEGAIAAGIRRLEAVTAIKAEEYINQKLTTIDEIAVLLKSTGNIRDSVEKLMSDNSALKSSIGKYQVQYASFVLQNIEDKAQIVNGIRFLSGQIETDSADLLKTIAAEAKKKSDNSVIVIGSAISGKASILVMVSDDLINERKINAINMIKEISAEINGGGGGQPFLATAGGKNPQGIEKAIKKAEEYLMAL